VGGSEDNRGKEWMSMTGEGRKEERREWFIFRGENRCKCKFVYFC